MTFNPPTREPLLLAPLLKPRVWGGDRLRRFGRAGPPGVRIGESWELADLDDSIPEGRSRIAQGPLAGRTIREVIDADPEGVLGLAQRSAEGGFPLLIKFLDAAEALSVQVHPDAAYAARRPEAKVKNEAWIILDAEPDAVIYRGVRPEVDRERFFRDLKRGDILEHLIAVPVAPGDCIDLPSGLCHALGAGVLVAEVQTPSDTTFRLFDWNRRDPARPLHIAEARECMRFGAEQDLSPRSILRRRDRATTRAGGFETSPLIRTPHFIVESIACAAGAELPIVTNEAPVVWTLLEGGADLSGPNDRGLSLEPGNTLLLPAKVTGWKGRFPQESAFLRTTLPTALDRALASA